MPSQPRHPTSIEQQQQKNQKNVSINFERSVLCSTYTAHKKVYKHQLQRGIRGKPTVQYKKDTIFIFFGIIPRPNFNPVSLDVNIKIYFQDKSHAFSLKLDDKCHADISCNNDIPKIGELATSFATDVT